jgi:hypothetical protein
MPRRSSRPRELACLTSDLVDSKHEPRRRDVQLRLEKVLRSANATFRAELAVPLAVTLGDEWQGLARSVQAAFRVEFHVRRALRPLRMRSGIGLGPLSTPLRKRTAQMDGPCFHRSRAALAAAKKRGDSATVLDSGRPATDGYVNAVERLLHGVVDDWTEVQAESVLAYLDTGRETMAARARGVSQPTLHKSVASALGKEVLAVMEARNQFLAEAFGPDGGAA